MAGTVDSGNETLFSDDSSCDLVMSPSACELDQSISTPVSTPGRTIEHDVASEVSSARVAPPKIQPYSGVLEKVIYFRI